MLICIVCLLHSISIWPLLIQSSDSVHSCLSALSGSATLWPNTSHERQLRPLFSMVLPGFTVCVMEFSRTDKHCLFKSSVGPSLSACVSVLFRPKTFSPSTLQPERYIWLAQYRFPCERKNMAKHTKSMQLFRSDHCGVFRLTGSNRKQWLTTDWCIIRAWSGGNWKEPDVYRNWSFGSFQFGKEQPDKNLNRTSGTQRHIPPEWKVLP